MDRAKADIVLERLEAGESLRSAAETAGCSASTVLRWKGEDAEFAEQYARAREIGYQLLGDQLLEIADTPQLGEIRTVKPDGAEEVKYADMIEHRRLRVDSRKWMLSKMLPKVYGDKIEHEHKGGLTVTLQSGDEAL